MSKTTGVIQGKQGKKTLADRIGIKGKRKDGEYLESHSDECIADLDDQDTTIKEDEIVYYKVRKIVPRKELKEGMAR